VPFFGFKKIFGEIPGTERGCKKKSKVLGGGGGKKYLHAHGESMAYTVPIFAKLNSLLSKPCDKYGKYGGNFVQICVTEFHPNRAINMESTCGNFFSPEVKCGFCCVDFHATHVHLVIFWTSSGLDWFQTLDEKWRE